jgi:RNA-directed DNA polymerase
MLAPEPERTGHAPRPTRILSKAALRAAWDNSRDSTAAPGRPGIDGVSARQFTAKLDSNLRHIALRLGEGRYGFSRLRAVFIPKENSDKERIICIPTVSDRLVQRAIGRHLTSRSVLPIKNASSFGFIKGLGPRDAINRVVELRSKYDWCLKTDIQSFFDKVPRARLKTKVEQALRGSSLESLLLKVIDCEVRTTSENAQKLRKQGLTRGLGIRQGMPLSPLLANLALADFDKHVEDRRIKMVRYADDLVLFFRTKEEAREGHHYIRLLLATFQLSIPEIESSSKTKIVSRSDSLEFLGREVVFLGSTNSFVVRVSERQIEKIKERLGSEFSFKKRSEDGKNFQDTIVDPSKSVAAYLGLYKDAFNYPKFEAELKGLGRSIVSAIFRDLLGQEILRSLTIEGRKFLGIEILDAVEPNAELDV